MSPHSCPISFIVRSSNHSLLFILFYLHSYLHHEKKEAAFDELFLGKDCFFSKLTEEAASSFNRLKISQIQNGEYAEKRDSEKHQFKKNANQQVEDTKAQCTKKAILSAFLSTS